MSATDPDTGDTVSYSITAGNSEGKFSLGSSGDTITVADALNYESTTDYSLEVTASDGNGATATATVDINVIDVNEWPSFTSSTYSFTMREDKVSGVVGNVSASDPEGGSVLYRLYDIESGVMETTTEFYLWPRLVGGTNIWIGSTFDHETKDAYSLRVTAEDSTGRTGTADVNIVVEDVNEVSITGPADAVTEGEDMSFTVSVEAATASDVVATYSVAGGTATFNSDYQYASSHSCTQPGTTHCVTIPANATSVTIPFETVADGTHEAHETVVVRLSSVISTADVAIDTQPGKRTATGTIASPIVVPAIGDNGSQTSTVDVASVATSTLRFDLTGLDANRAYVVGITTASGTAVGAASLEPSTTPLALPGFANIGGGQFVWVEGGSLPIQGRRTVVVTFPHGSTATLDVTVSKPDLAIVSEPTATVPAWVSTPTTGTVELSMTIRNSASQGSDDDKSEIRVSCDPKRSNYHATWTHSFDSLRGSAGGSLIGAGGSRAVDVGSVCLGMALSAGTSQTTADEFSFRIRVVVDDETLHEVRLPDPDDDYRWPFAVSNTLWHPQTSTTGGLQMIVRRPGAIGLCTLSFPLRLRTRGGTGAGSAAMSTTGHCTDPGQTWEQGSYPLVGEPANVPLGTAQMVPSSTTCRILGKGGMETLNNCRRGDHAYASGASPPTGSRIFRPAEENESNDVDNPVIQYFAEHATNTFEIVGARPPDEGDTVHKVGRTTGWTYGEVKDFSEDGGNDPICPGNRVGIDEHEAYADPPANTIVAYYVECLVRAVFTVDGGDSGAPVFVEKNPFSTASDREVLLVGVIYGHRGNSIGAFIPIERVYAESLMRGFDWLPEWLRPVPVLDLDEETLVLADDGSAIMATFDKRDLSQGRGLTYKAVLYRNGAQVEDGNGDVYSREVSRGAGDDSSFRTVSFSLSAGPFPASIPFDQRNGVFTVRVRLCPYVDSSDAATPTDSYCGGYGSDGGTALTVPPAPENLSVPDSTDGVAEISWDSVGSATTYRAGYKLGGTDWTELPDVTTTNTSTTLSCGFYDFRVRAKGNASSYGGRWGFWSEPVGSVGIFGGPCPGTWWTTYDESATSTPHTGGAPPAPQGLTATSTASSVTLTWKAPDALTVAGYTILRKVLGEAEMSVHVEDTGSVEARYVDSVAVEAGTTYVYRVMAIGAGGAGAQSDPVEIATGDAVKETTSWR